MSIARYAEGCGNANIREGEEVRGVWRKKEYPKIEERGKRGYTESSIQEKHEVALFFDIET